MYNSPAKVASSEGASSWRPTLTLYLLFSHYVIFGCVIGVRGVIWPDVLAMLPIDQGQFGSAQVLPYLISTILLIQYARIAARFSAKSIMLSGLALVVFALLALAHVSTLWGFVFTVVLLGAGTGSMDGAITQASLDWEYAARRRRMNFLHSGFSAGAVLGALAAGAGMNLHLNFSQILLLLAASCVLTLLVSLMLRYPPTMPPVTVGLGHGWRTMFGNTTIRALILICFLSVIIESVAFVWSVIYLRTELNATPLLGGAGFALFNSAMFCGRLLNAPLVARYGARASLVLSGLALALAAVVLLLARDAGMAVAALAVLGLGVAGVFPTVIGAAGDIVPSDSGMLTGIILSCAYVALMITPPVVGWIAQASSLRSAMALLLLCGGAMVLLALRLPPLHRSVIAQEQPVLPGEV